MDISNMITVHLRFYEELNDFLPPKLRKVRFEKKLKFSTTVKDIIESCGVPHTEVKLILINGKSTDFNYHINDKDDISLYPIFESIDISGLTKLESSLPEEVKFIAGRNVGKLVRNLRLLGFDVVHDQYAKNSEILRKMKEDNRILLTRDRNILMCNEVQYGCYIYSNEPFKQTVEVVQRFKLVDAINAITRCSLCNSLLEPVQKKEILHRLKPLTKKYFEEFVRCTRCDKIYWHGSHHIKLRQFIKRVEEEVKTNR